MFAKDETGIGGAEPVMLRWSMAHYEYHVVLNTSKNSQSAWRDIFFLNLVMFKYKKCY